MSGFDEVPEYDVALLMLDREAPGTFPKFDLTGGVAQEDKNNIIGKLLSQINITGALLAFQEEHFVVHHDPVHPEFLSRVSFYQFEYSTSFVWFR